MAEKDLMKHYCLKKKIIFISTWISMANIFKKTEMQLELSTEIDILLMVEKEIGFLLNE